MIKEIWLVKRRKRQKKKKKNMGRKEEPIKGDILGTERERERKDRKKKREEKEACLKRESC